MDGDDGDEGRADLVVAAVVVVRVVGLELYCTVRVFLLPASLR